MKKLLLLILLGISINTYSQKFTVEGIFTNNPDSVGKFILKEGDDITILNDSVVRFNDANSCLEYKVNNYWEENDIVYYDLQLNEKYLGLKVGKLSNNFYMIITGVYKILTHIKE